MKTFFLSIFPQPNKKPNYIVLAMCKVKIHRTALNVSIVLTSLWQCGSAVFLPKHQSPKGYRNQAELKVFLIFSIKPTPFFAIVGIFIITELHLQSNNIYFKNQIHYLFLIHIRTPYNLYIMCRTVIILIYILMPCFPPFTPFSAFLCLSTLIINTS